MDYVLVHTNLSLLNKHGSFLDRSPVLVGLSVIKTFSYRCTAHLQFSQQYYGVSSVKSLRNRQRCTYKLSTIL